MNLFKINFESESVYKGQNGNITGEISISLNEYYFPEKNWNDFVVIIINWWLENIDYSSLKADGVFRFMDGPFYFEIKGEQEIVNISFGQNGTILKRDKISKQVLFDEVKNAAIAILKVCQDLKWENSEIDILKQKVIALSRPE